MSRAAAAALPALAPEWFAVAAQPGWVVLFNGSRVLRGRLSSPAVLDAGAAPLGPALLARLHPDDLRSLAEIGVLARGRQRGGDHHASPAPEPGARVACPTRLPGMAVFGGSRLGRLAASALEQPERTPTAAVRAPGELAPGGGVLLYASDYFWESRLTAWEARARAAGAAFLPVRVVDGELVVGPCLRPRAPVCMQCYRRRMAARRSINPETRLLFDTLFSTPGCHVRVSPPPAAFLRALAAGLAVVERAVEQGGEGAAEAPLATVDLATGAARLHWLAAAPACGHDPPPGEPVERPQDAGVASDHVGLVRALGDIAPPEVDGGVVVVAASTVSLAPLLGSWAEGLACEGGTVGGGVSTSPALAQAKAVSEVLERAAVWVAAGPLPGITAAYRELAEPAVEPGRWILFSRSQYASAGFPFVPFGRDTTVRWVRGTRLGSGQPCWVPQALVSDQFRPPPGCARIGHYSTSGMAAHFARDAARLSGLLELVERDAVLTGWLLRLPLLHLAPPRSGAAGAEGDAARYRACLRAAGFRVDSYLLPTDLQATVAVSVGFREDGRRPRFAFGAAARLDAPAALARSLEEACQFLGWDEELIPAHFDPGPGCANVRGFMERYLYYNNPESWAELDAWRARASPVELGEVPPPPPRDLPELVEALRGQGYEPVAVPVPLPDARAAGRVVTAVLVPGLHPVNADHRLSYGDLRRVRQAARNLRHPFHASDLNLAPHPLP